MPEFIVLLPDELRQIVQEAVLEALTAHDEQRVDSWMTVKEVADYIRCGTTRIYMLTSRGLIPCHRDGKRVLFLRQEIDEWLTRPGSRK